MRDDPILSPPICGAPAAAGDFEFERDIQRRAIRAGLSAGDDFETK